MQVLDEDADPESGVVLVVPPGGLSEVISALDASGINHHITIDDLER